MLDSELDNAIKATQQSLGKYLKKPPLTEKLLKKPPFRYLMDIFTAFIKETGCFEGLYTPEEQLFENISDRNDKTRFLQKMIDVTKLTTKLDLKVRTSKIVAGHEPKLTNELLQAMASVIEQRLEWEDAVQLVLESDADKSKPTKPKETKTTSKQISPTGKEQQQPQRKEKRISPQEQKLRKATELATRTTPTEKEKPQRRQKPSPEAETKPKLSKQSSKQKTPSPNKPTSKIKQQASSESDIKSMSPAPAVLSPSPKTKAKKTPSPKEKPALAAEEPVKQPSPPPTTPAPAPAPAVEPIPSVEPDSRKSSSKSRRSSASQRQAASEADSNDLPKATNESNEQSTISTSSTIPAADSNNNNNNIGSETKRERENTFTRENSKDSNGSVTRPRTSLRPPSARPASARPGAPRRRNVEIVLQPNEQLKMSGVSVKLETFGDFDDDGENLVVIEDANAHDIVSGTAEAQLDLDANQGRLVQQILETQKELVQQGTEPGREESQQKLPTSATRQSSARQVNDLRDIIQTITKSVNPLGKLMDFIPEDIDAMQLELTMWQEAYTQAAAELKRERSLTESATEPMKQQLLSIEANIVEYKELIDESRHKILQNNERILKMLIEQ